MSLVCQYTIMSPTASSAPTSQQTSRLNQRRNAMANVHDGMSNNDLNLIRIQAPDSLQTACPTCVSTATSSSPASRPRSGSNASSSDIEASASGLSALAYQPPSSSSPLQSPSLKHRRNAVPDVLAMVDPGTLGRIRAASQSSPSHQNESQDDHQNQFTF